MKQPAVYIMANKRNGTLYTGVTSNLVQRVYRHREALVPGFTERYGEAPCPVRAARRHGWRHHPREADQGWIAQEEVGAD
jgi:predicted GIY-YIG superfamily endonuclease